MEFSSEANNYPTGLNELVVQEYPSNQIHHAHQQTLTKASAHYTTWGYRNVTLKNGNIIAIAKHKKKAEVTMDDYPS